MNAEDFAKNLKQDQVPWRLFTPNASNKDFCVLWLQGWSSSMDSHREGVERMAKKTGVAFATLDFAGHGLHKVALEESTRHQQLDEVVAIFDELKERGYEKIITIGGSFGAYIAALLCGVRPVHAVVLRSAAIYDDKEFDLAFKQTARWEDPSKDRQDRNTAPYISDNMAVHGISNFDGFTYVLEHELDEQVPSVMPKAYFEAAKHGNYLIIPNTMHSPKLMPNPQAHFDYIEHCVISIIEAVKLQVKLTTR